MLRQSFIWHFLYGISLVVLGSCSGSTSGSVSSSTGTINGSVSVGSVTITEGENYTLSVNFDQELPSAAELTWSIVQTNQPSSSALASVLEWIGLSSGDFASMSGTLNLNAGATSASLTIESLADDTFEGEEYFDVVFSGGFLINEIRVPVTLTDTDEAPTLSLANAYVLEGEQASLIFTLNRRSQKSVVFTLVLTPDAGVTADVDYLTPSTLQISIPSNQLTQVVPLTTVSNSLATGDRRVGISVTGVTNATAGFEEKSLFILDDDVSVQLSVADATVSENVAGGEASVTVSLSQAASQAIAFDWEVRSDTAIAGKDFALVERQQMVIAQGDTSATIKIPIIDDLLDETDETFKVFIGNVRGGATLDTNAYEATVTITDNDAEPTLEWELASQTVMENSGTVTVKAKLSNPSGRVTGAQILVSGTANSNDHSFTATALAIPDGQDSHTLSFQLIDDNLAAGAKTLILTLDSAQNASLGSQIVHTINIIDDDGDPVLFIGNASVDEDAGTAQLSVGLGSGLELGEYVEFDWATSNLTATSGSDYTASSGTSVRIDGPATSSSISIPILDDTIYEGPEMFTVTLSNVSGAATLQSGGETGYITIVDNELGPTVEFNLASQTVGENVGSVQVQVNLGQEMSQDLRVPYTVTGTAIRPDDHNLATGVLTIAAGQTTANISVNIVDDSSSESDETIIISLGDPNLGATLGQKAVHTLTIQDNDGAPTISIADDTVTEGSPLEFNVTLSGASGQTVTADYTIALGTASSQDINPSSMTGKVTFFAGETAKTISIPTVNDSLYELDETITVTLSNLVGASAGTLTATGTIQDNETGLSLSINNASATEGGDVTFTVTLSNVATYDVSVDYATADGNNGDANLNATTGDNDYSSTSGTLTITAGQTSNTITVSTTSDTDVEEDEQFRVILSNATNGASISQATGIGTITNDDLPPPSPPTVTGVSSPTADGAYKEGDEITIEVTFNEAVTVSGGAPQITLETGGSDAVVSLTSGSGTTKLSGVYTVQASHTSSDLDYVSTSSLSLNGSTIVSAATAVAAELDLVTPGTAGSLGNAKALVIDTTAPADPSSLVDGNYFNSSTASATITFTGGTDTGGSGIAEHQARVVLGSDTSVTLSSWATLTSGSSISGLTLVDATEYKVQIKAIDNAGNESAVVTSDGWTVDVTPPTVPTSISLGADPSTGADSPPITFTSGTDGGSGVSHHQAKVIKTSDSSVEKDWSTIASGSSVTGLTLTDGVEYGILLKSVDNAGNYSSESTMVTWTAVLDPCYGPSPAPGTVCAGGAIYAGALSWGATSKTSGSPDRYMTTPGGCGEVPEGHRAGTCPGASCLATSNFTPVCDGSTDYLKKTWCGCSSTSSTWYEIPDMESYSSTGGNSYQDTNRDLNYGSHNTDVMKMLTASENGGYHRAAWYCYYLVYGGYDDWFLPNRYELNLLGTNKANIPGLNTTDYYWSSTQRSNRDAWRQIFNDYNAQSSVQKYNNTILIRCMRKF